MVASLVGVFGWGSRETAFESFAIAAHEGSITSVRVLEHGGVVEQVQWKQGFLHRHFATSPRERSATGPVPRQVKRDVVTYLHANYPDLKVNVVEELPRAANIGKMTAPTWAWFGLLGSWLASFVLLGAINNPWRLNNAGWLWVLLSGFPGVLIFLLLAAPVPGVPKPDPNHRVLNGWQGFLIAIPLSALSRFLF